MGGDGGSIPGRADVVRTAGFRFVRNLGGMGYSPNTQIRAGSEKFLRTEEKRLRWTTCALTQEPLKPPLSACRLGQLYNRETLISRLLHRKTVPLPPNMSHIESRRDFKDLNVELKSERLICPIMKIEFGAGVKGAFLWTCGCVISIKALDNLTNSGKIESPQCPVCNKEYDYSTDVVQLVPDLEKIPDLKAQIARQQQLDNLEKKAQKKTKQKENHPVVSETEDIEPKRKHLRPLAHPMGPVQSECSSAAKKVKLAEDKHQEKSTTSAVYRSLFQT